MNINIEAETAASIARTMVLPAAVSYLNELKPTGLDELIGEVEPLIKELHFALLKLEDANLDENHPDSSPHEGGGVHARHGRSRRWTTSATSPTGWRSSSPTTSGRCRSTRRCCSSSSAGSGRLAAARFAGLLAGRSTCLAAWLGSVRMLALLMARDYLEAITSRVVVYDGGMGATLEQFELTSEDYGGLQGKCHEALVLNRPDVIEGVHASMLEAGAEVRRDRHLPGLADQARGVGPGRLHGRDQHEGRGNRAQGRGRAPLRRRLDRPDRLPARLRRALARADPLPASWSRSSQSRPPG